MHKWIMFIVFIAASVLGVYLLTFGLPDKPVDPAKGLPEGMTLLQIKASNDFVFDKPEYVVKQGDSVRMMLQNTSGIHGLIIPELNIELAGDVMEIDHTFDQAGEFTIECSIPCGTGHTTMVSKLIVEAA